MCKVEICCHVAIKGHSGNVLLFESLCVSLFQVAGNLAWKFSAKWSRCLDRSKRSDRLDFDWLNFRRELRSLLQQAAYVYFWQSLHQGRDFGRSYGCRSLAFKYCLVKGHLELWGRVYYRLGQRVKYKTLWIRLFRIERLVLCEKCDPSLWFFLLHNLFNLTDCSVNAVNSNPAKGRLPVTWHMCLLDKANWLENVCDII